MKNSPMDWIWLAVIIAGFFIAIRSSRKILVDILKAAEKRNNIAQATINALTVLAARVATIERTQQVMAGKFDTLRTSVDKLRDDVALLIQKEATPGPTDADVDAMISEVNAIDASVITALNPPTPTPDPVPAT